MPSTATVLGAAGDVVSVVFTTDAAAALAQPALTAVSSVVAADPAAAVPFVGTLPASGTELLFAGESASAVTLPADTSFDAIVADASLPATITDASATAKTIVAGAAGLTYTQTAASVAGSLIVIGGGSSLIDLAAGANTIGVDVTPSTVIAGTSFGDGNINALAGGAEILVDTAVNTATTFDQTLIQLGNDDTVRIDGYADLELADASNLVSVEAGGTALVENLAASVPASTVYFGAGRESVGALPGTGVSLSGAAGGGTIDILGNATLGGAFTVNAGASDIVDTVRAAAVTLLGNGEGGASNTGSDSIVGASGDLHAGSGGNSLLVGSAAQSGVTTVAGGGSGDTLGAMSDLVSLLGAAGTAILEASGMTVAGGVAKFGSITLPASGAGVSVPGADGGVTINAGASDGLIFGATGGADTIISGSGAATAYGHSGAQTGSGVEYVDGAFYTGQPGTLSIADFVAADQVLLGASERITGVSGGGAAPSEVTLSTGSKIVFLNGFITAGNAATYIQPDPFIACFVAGTRIATARNGLAVEHLREGQRVRTVSGKLARIVWLGERAIDCRRHRRPRDVLPIRVRAHAFGQPRHDVLLSPDHAVFADGVLIPVRCLLNGISIVQEDADAVVYHHVELAAHDVILAEGLPCESYLDTGNRSAFANAGNVMQLHPDFAPRIWDGSGYAERVLAGPRLEAVQARLAQNCGMTDTAEAVTDRLSQGID